MKKLFSVITSIALALSLTACQKPGQHSDKQPDDSRTPEEIQAEYEQFLKQRYEEALSEIPDDLSLTLPDGSVVTKADIAGYETNGEYLYFDFAFIRYAEPIFTKTKHEPPKKAINESPQWFKVKPGDSLKDGSTVAKARTAIYINYEGKPELCDEYIQLAGEVTYEGIFKYYDGSGFYGGGDYYYYFYPDSTKYDIPVLYNYESEKAVSQSAWLFGEDYLYYDGFGFYHFRFEDDFKSRLTEDTVCNAKITFKDPFFGRATTSEIVQAELDL